MNKRRNRPIKMDAPLYEFVMLPGFNGVGHGGKADMFGLEIELEGRKIVTNDKDIGAYWGQHKDGSLRCKDPLKDQAIEYVFHQPLDMSLTEKALKVLYSYLNKAGVQVFDSYRTSIHVHVNCANDTIRTVCNYITLAMIFDELFVSQNGQTRIGNNFCLRTRDAEGQISDLIQSITAYGDPCSAFPKHNRYSSVNMASLSKFGTIEFRSLECTTDLDRVVHWIKTLQALKESARKYTNPIDIISTFSQKGPLAFITYNLGQQAHKYIKVDGYHEMLHTGMRLAQDFAFCTDWIVTDKDEDDVYNKYAKKKVMKKLEVNHQLGAFANYIHNDVAMNNMLGHWNEEQPAWNPGAAAAGLVQPVAAHPAPNPGQWGDAIGAVPVPQPQNPAGEVDFDFDDFPMQDPDEPDFDEAPVDIDDDDL